MTEVNLDPEAGSRERDREREKEENETQSRRECERKVREET